MSQLLVALNGIEVGTLEKARSGAMTFQYLKEWVDRPGARATSLSLPLTLAPYKGEKVYNFFDNLLPDSDTLRARMQARFRVASSHPFDLLASVGRDCIGAIQLYPNGMVLPDVTQTRARPLNNRDIENLLAGYQDAPLGMAKDHDFRISLAGAQEKTALLWHQNQWQLPLGSTPTSHIFKLPIGFLEHSNIDLRESSENEWLCLQILKAFGLPTANADLACFGNQSILIVEHFDRKWSSDGSWLMRLPQEDFCQALGISPALKYESDGGPGLRQCMKILEGSQNARQDRDRFFKTQLVFWLLAAIDGHAKNFSLFLEPGSAYRMTPLYDVISAYPLMTQGSLAPARAKMLPRHFLSTAKAMGFSPTRAAAIMEETVAQTEAVIESVNARLPNGFPAKVADPILTGLRAQALKLGSNPNHFIPFSG
ncbi:type II toxin-antitoxin system HipA family toxin [Marinobacter vinifirmus]|uniref:Type II toxin-antitoxin system HipA family toxin n=1 Tax=Marinobacter vinifirmus TaxID=355591 RepID=A0A558BD67_9GAMM|nr:type II toxin-antitoxin system HipA family toxin [Marinobacter vinifirmus]TVT34453.1 MAG: type II toxin-antitoxin system HipA family toxin [Marinobacter vinifirmus]